MKSSEEKAVKVEVEPEIIEHPSLEMLEEMNKSKVWMQQGIAFGHRDCLKCGVEVDSMTAPYVHIRTHQIRLLRESSACKCDKR